MASYQSSGCPPRTVLGIPGPSASNITTGIQSNPNNIEAQPQPTINIPATHDTQMPPRDNLTLTSLCCSWWYAKLVLAGMVQLACIICLVKFANLGDGDYEKPTFEVNSMIVSPLNVSGTRSDPRITAHWDIGFLITNCDDKVKINYRKIDVSLWYKTELLIQEIIKPFSQQAKNQTLFKVGSGLLGKQMFDDGAWLSMAEDLREGSVEFQIYLRGRIDFKGHGESKLKVSCPNVRVEFSSTATTTAATSTMGGSSTCKVRVKHH